jgi:hypothetical protein
MFNEGDLVRLITEEGEAEIASVIQEETDGTVIIRYKDHSPITVDAGDYELVTATPTVHEEVAQPMVANIPTRTEKDIHEDICKMFVQVFQFMEPNLNSDNMSINVEANHRAGTTDNIDIRFDVGIGYGDKVTSDNLFTSARIVLHRHNEDKSLNPVCIPLYKDAAE